MEFLNRAYEQLSDLFRSMSPAARVTAGMLLAVVIISLTFLVRFQTSGGGELLFGGRPLSSSELNAIEAAFAENGLTDWDIDHGRISVPSGQKHLYLGAIVQGEALPEGFYDHFEDVMQSSPFDSRDKTQLKSDVAKQRELALIFRNMKGIDDASVQCDEEEKGGLHREKVKTALASIRAADGRTLDSQEVRAIRAAMVSAVAGLDSSNVSVLDLNDGRIHRGEDAGGLANGNASYLEKQSEAEDYYRSKIEAKLAMIPGVLVGVNVELDTKQKNESTQLTYGGQPYAMKSSESSKEVASTTPSPGGRVGAVPNGVGNRANAVNETTLASAESTETETRGEQQNVMDQTTTLTTEAPHAVKLVTAAISIPSSYYVRVLQDQWRLEHPLEVGQAPPIDMSARKAFAVEENNRIQDEIVQLLPTKPPGDDPYIPVKVTTYEHFGEDPVEEPALSETAFTWLGANWRSLGMVLVALLSLGMLRSMLRSLPAVPPREPSLSLASLPPSEAEERSEAAPRAEPTLSRRFGSKGPNLRQELTELVREDPDAAANVIRGWIGDAA